MKTHISVIFGGESPEHNISIRSAKSVLENIDHVKYHVHPIYVDKNGSWYLLMDYQQLLAYSSDQPIDMSCFSYKPVILKVSNINFTQDEFYVFNQYSATEHVVIPLIHGCKGEDGSLQGLLEYCNCPYVGAAVLPSALAMNKAYFKDLLVRYNILTAKYIVITKKIKPDQYNDLVAAQLTYPLFVKPCNSGSSIGISKVTSEKKLHQAIDIALRYDQQIIIEQAVKGREFECAILGNDDPQVSALGEIVSENEFYDYNAKYIDSNATKTIVPALIDASLQQNVQMIAKEIYTKLSYAGMARIDLFIDEQNNIYINELNSIPGFTSISLYPKLWEIAGKSYSSLLDDLIFFATDSYNNKLKLLTEYTDASNLQLVE